MLDDAVSPIIGEPQGFTELAFGAEQALDFGVFGLQHLVDIGLGDAELFSRQHREIGPFHNVEPLIIALADGWAERLFGNDFRQHDMVVRLCQTQTL